MWTKKLRFPSKRLTPKLRLCTFYCGASLKTLPVLQNCCGLKLFDKDLLSTLFLKIAPPLNFAQDSLLKFCPKIILEIPFLQKESFWWNIFRFHSAMYILFIKVLQMAKLILGPKAKLKRCFKYSPSGELGPADVSQICWHIMFHNVPKCLTMIHKVSKYLRISHNVF